MPYQAPTTASLKIRYPEFEPVPDAQVEAVLSGVIAEVGDDWDELYRARAQMALACHMMASEGEPQRSITVAAGGNASAATGAVKRRKVGDVEVELTDSRVGSADQGISREVLGSSPYGREFLRLQALSFPGALLI